MPEPESTSIAFAGFMGAGKSRAAREAAAATGLELVDTDREIEAAVGTTIGEYFEREGEAAFREVEERVVLDALGRGVVVALGGGAVESERIGAALSDHVTAWCRVDEGLAWERSSGTGRPLAADREEFRRRYEARIPLYGAVARAVLPSGGDEVGRRAGPWLAAMRRAPATRLAWASAGEAHYPALIGAGATELAGADPAWLIGARRFALADSAALAARPELLPESEATIELDGGEASKTIAEAERLLAGLAELGVRRDDALIAFGGGVAGDLGGFVAALYQRGVPVIHVPTTLVAQVDSAYGGKTGVDLAAAKNYVGAYHQPAAVLADPAALETLPAEELAAGFAEVVKTALIAGGDLWDRVRSLEQIDAAALAPLVFDCARTKIDVVAADERDAGGRAVLNLGHTVGHGIEAATGYARYRHGEAVALGMLAALRLSDAPELRAEVTELWRRAGLPVQLDSDVDVALVLEAAGRDKKRTAGGIGFVLVERPGAVVHGASIDADSLRAAVEELRAQR